MRVVANLGRLDQIAPKQLVFGFPGVDTNRFFRRFTPRLK